MRFDVVVREVFIILLGTKKDVCTVMTTDQGLYVIHTGRYGAVIEIGTELGGLSGMALSAMSAADKKKDTRKVEENQAKITPSSLDELGRQKGNVFIPFEEIVKVELRSPKAFPPSPGPVLKIKAKKKKFKLVFFHSTSEDVQPLVELLQSHMADESVS